MRQRAFTLIELLVVIAIVGILSSVVLAALNVARENGRVGAGKQFAAGLDRAAGDQALGLWDFDECSGTTAYDGSGNSNTGTLTNGPVWTSDTPSGKGCALIFDGTNDYIQLATSRIGQQLNGSSALSVSAWVKYSALNAAQYGNVIVSVRNNSSASALWLNIRGDGAEAGRVVVGGRSRSTDAFLETSSSVLLRPDRWHHVAGVLNFSANTITLYVDGAQVGKSTVAFGSPTYLHGTPSMVDSIDNGGASMGDSATYTLNARIDAVHLFAKALTAQDVERTYAQGAVWRLADLSF